MGKKYYCDYCDKKIAATPAIVRTHNSGIMHQMLVRDHYKQYTDPEVILAEESYKKPCTRFAKGQCLFGSICRYSHYTKEQIRAFEDYVANKSKCKAEKAPSFQELYKNLQSEKSVKSQESGNINTTLSDKNGMTYVLPWTYNQSFDKYGEKLPPSIKRLKVEDFMHANLTEWG